MTMIKGDRVTARLEALDRGMRVHRLLWSPQPFRTGSVPWEAEFPGLVAQLETLSVEEILAIDRDPVRHRALVLPHIPELASLDALCTLQPWMPKMSLAALGPRAQRHISERKWSQVKAFVVALSDVPAPVCRTIEWCAGKGHLGRTLSIATEMPVVCLERDNALCVAGQHLADRAGAAVQMVCHDVLH
ncbi:MAG: hypothetical protein AAFX99_08825, partial [Myxococcota bacterium]